MKILFLAPEPFFQERGTPIAVRLALEVLSERKGDVIDLLTYHEGEKVVIPGVAIHRIKMPAWVKGVGPGASLKKLLCDLAFLVAAVVLVFSNRRKQYHVVHAVEESVFIAALIKLVFGIPYIYDMDSSLSLQLTGKWKALKPFAFCFEFLEKWAVRHSVAVVPVCDALAVIAKRHGSKSTTVLSDISLLDVKAPKSGISLKGEAGIGDGAKVLLYIGNLEHYQGIDLMVDGFALAAAEIPEAHVVIIGGRDEHISAYRKKAAACGLEGRMHFIGPRPVSSLNDYLRQADVLVSPRIEGNNTPMKIYSYLHSGIPILATRLFTHTQILDDRVAKLVKPDAEDFSRAMVELIKDGELRERLGNAARGLAEARYTFGHFKQTLNAIYDAVVAEIGVKIRG